MSARVASKPQKRMAYCSYNCNRVTTSSMLFAKIQRSSGDTLLMKAALYGLLNEIKRTFTMPRSPNDRQDFLFYHSSGGISAQLKASLELPRTSTGQREAKLFLRTPPQEPRSLSHNPFSQPNLPRPKRPSHDVGGE